MTSEPPPPPPPGYYPNPSGTGERYWDGSRWSEPQPEPVPVTPAGWYGEGEDRRYWDGTQWEIQSSRGDALVTWGLVCAFLLPLLGLILGIVALAQGKSAAPFVVSLVTMVVYFSLIA